MSNQLIEEALDEWQARADARSNLPLLMTRKQVAELFHVCVDTVINWEKAGRLTSHRYGHSTVRITRDSVLLLMHGKVR